MYHIKYGSMIDPMASYDNILDLVQFLEVFSKTMNFQEKQLRIYNDHSGFSPAFIKENAPKIVVIDNFFNEEKYSKFRLYFEYANISVKFMEKTDSILRFTFPIGKSTQNIYFPYWEYVKEIEHCPENSLEGEKLIFFKDGVQILCIQKEK